MGKIYKVTIKSSLIIFTLLLIQGCNLNKHHSIVGKWNSCGDGYYHELHIKKNMEIIGFHYSIGDINWFYSIVNDSVKFFFQTGTIINTFNIKNLSHNEMCLTNDSICMIYYKLKDDVDFRKLESENSTKRDEFIADFLIRVKNSACN